MNSFFSLRTYCALRARCAVGCFGRSFFAARQKTNQKNAWGLRPWIPRRAAAHCSRRGQGKAQRFGQVQMLRLVRHRLQDGLGWGSMPDLGGTRPSHSEKGGVWFKTDLQNGKNITQIFYYFARQSWASEAMPNKGKLTPRISKKGSVAQNPFAKRKGDIHAPP